MTDRTESGSGEAVSDGSRLSGPNAVAPLAADPNAAAVLAIGALVVAFGSVAGPEGVIGGLATAAVWYALGTPYAVAFGHVALVVLFSEGIDPVSFGVVEATFVGLVTASRPQTAHETPVRYAAIAVASAGAAGSLGWLVLGRTSLSIWVAAIVPLAALAAGAYGIHRYELVFVVDRLAHDHGGQRRAARDDAEAEPSPEGDRTAFSSTDAPES